MSRITLLNGTVWLGGNRQANAGGFGKARVDGYPPFNIELLPTDEDGVEILRITLAVAGFQREELDVTFGNGELVVRGAQSDDDPGAPREYLHRGIAARQFKRSFGLADGVEVCKAELHNGLLTIELRRLHKMQPVRNVGIASSR